MFSSEQYRALREASGLVDRSRRGRLRLTGPDRREYLQGLLTNDITALQAGEGCYAALLTAQGRMISDMYVSETGDSTMMDLEPEVTERVRGLLEQFIFSEDVQVTDQTATVAQLGVVGPAAADVVACALAWPSNANAREDLVALPVLGSRMAAWGGAPVIVVRRDDLGVPELDLFVGRGESDALAAAILAAGAVRVDDETADVTRVESGRPQFKRDMDEETIPLEAGIEARAISLTKGCYVGQEIIVRVLHRGPGRVAKRLVGLTLPPSSEAPARGDRVRGGDREIGIVTSAVRSPLLDRPIALAYAHRDFVEPQTPVAVIRGDRVLPAVVSELPFVAVPAFASRVRSAPRQPAETPDR
jgi:folate-binding protein YgfZ